MGRAKRIARKGRPPSTRGATFERKGRESLGNRKRVPLLPSLRELPFWEEANQGTG